MNKSKDNGARMMYNNRIRGHLSMPKTSAANLRAIKKYQQKHIVQVKINLHREKDADILEKLDQVDNKQGYIKTAIRENMKRENEE